ncbi:MAG: 5-(carboxyamino)imidazole ribonucleotide synthase [Pseudomonadota bacterium]
MTVVKQTIVGILGGGQLGRMSAMAAARLGIQTHIYCPEANCPASLVTPHFTCAEYTDKAALETFAKAVDVITYEFENIPVETVEYLKLFKPVYPDEELLKASQDRTKEKDFLNGIGIPTAPWAEIKSAADIDKTFDQWGFKEGILKTARFGYDGKGQIKISEGDDTATAWEKLKTDKAVLEGIIDFDYEVSIIIARDIKGHCAVYPLSKNDHKNHILWKTTAPISSATIEREAAYMAHELAEAVNLVGVLAIEFFVTKDGKLLANEIAPRTHNSGHWTIDACSVSQFENHIRCVAGLPVGKVGCHSSAEMINLLGEDILKLDEYHAMEGANIHLYGKTDAKPGRKMGHVTIVKK